MDRTFTITYTPALIRSATNHFWRRKGGLRDTITTAVLAAGFIAYVAITGDHSFWVGAFGILVVIALVLPAFVYFIYRRRAAEKLRKMGSPVATARITDGFLSMRSGAGSGDIPWKTIEYVWAFPDVWLMFIGKDNYFTLPTADLDDEVRDFIKASVTQAGGHWR